jgi:hypothetical protein
MKSLSILGGGAVVGGGGLLVGDGAAVAEVVAGSVAIWDDARPTT